MIWEEALVDRTLGAAEVAQAVTQLLPVDPADLLVVPDITQAEVPGHMKVVCELTPMGGEFPLRVSFYIRDSSLESGDSREFIRRFCDLLHCRCLVSDGSPDPYTMLLVEGEGKERVVSLDTELLDEHEQYAVQGGTT